MSRVPNRTLQLAGGIIRSATEMKMPFLMDIYALAPERSAAAVERFLNRFLPDRDRADADYWVRLGNAHPVAVFETPEEMARYCEANPDAEARAYWNTLVAGDPQSAHVFFLPAGGLVLGLSVAAEHEDAWDEWLDRLLSFARTEHGYWTGECPPEDNVEKFIAMAQEARRTKG